MSLDTSADNNATIVKSKCAPSRNTSIKLSIITICYNEKGIEDTCRSVSEQTWQDFEWIVVDGGSTDGTLDVLERYKNRINLLISEKDNGRYDAMNKGVVKAVGEFVLFLNGGDYFIDTHVLQRVFQYKAIPNHESWSSLRFDADINYGQVITKETGMMPWPVWTVGPQSFDLTFFARYSLPHQATFIKRILFERHGLYDTSFQSAGDMEWFMRVILLHNVNCSYIPMPITVYSFDGISSTHGGSLDSIPVAESTYAYIEIEKALKKNISSCGVDELTEAKENVLKQNYIQIRDATGFNYLNCLFKSFLYKLLHKLFHSSRFKEKLEKYKFRLEQARYYRALIFSE